MKVSSDISFLKNLFTTEIYLIKETDRYPQNQTDEVIAEEPKPPFESPSDLVIFLTSEPSDTEIELLKKILSSIDSSIEKVSIHLQPGSSPGRSFSPNITKAISFGINITLPDTINLIRTVSLSQLDLEVSSKKELWAQLKAEF